MYVKKAETLPWDGVAFCSKFMDFSLKSCNKYLYPVKEIEAKRYEIYVGADNKLLLLGQKLSS